MLAKIPQLLIKCVIIGLGIIIEQPDPAPVRRCSQDRNIMSGEVNMVNVLIIEDDMEIAALEKDYLEINACQVSV